MSDRKGVKKPTTTNTSEIIIRDLLKKKTEENTKKRAFTPDGKIVSSKKKRNLPSLPTSPVQKTEPQQAAEQNPKAPPALNKLKRSHSSTNSLNESSISSSSSDLSDSMNEKKIENPTQQVTEHLTTATMGVTRPESIPKSTWASNSAKATPNQKPVTWPNKPSQPKPCSCKCNCSIPARPIPVILTDARKKYVETHNAISKMSFPNPEQGVDILNALNSLAVLFKEISDNVLGKPAVTNITNPQPAKTSNQNSNIGLPYSKIAGSTPLMQSKKDIRKTIEKQIRRSTNTDSSDRVVVIELSEEIKKTSEPKKSIINLIKPAENGLQIKSMKENRGKIVIVTNTPEQAKKIINLNSSLKHAGQIRSPREIKPKMILLNAPADFSSDTLAETIVKQNPGLNLSVDDFKPIYKTGKRDLPECHWVMTVSPEAREKFLKVNRIFVDYQSCKIHDYTNIKRCYKCQRYGHRSIECRDTIDTCAHCAVKGHKSESCPSKDKPAICANCTRHKNPNNHSVRNELCPVYLSATKTSVRKTNYKASNG